MSCQRVGILAAGLYILVPLVSCTNSDSVGKVAGNHAGSSTGGTPAGGGGAGGTTAGGGSPSVPDAGTVPDSAQGGSPGGNTSQAGAGTGGYAKGGAGAGGTTSSSTCLITNLYCPNGYQMGPDGCPSVCAPAPNDAGPAGDGGRSDSASPDSGSVLPPEAGSESGRDISPARPDLASDIAPVASCTGQPDFTPCAVVTTPDRKYDVCMDGICVSPGCGDTTCNVSGPHFALADTGQRTCTDESTGTIACPAPGTALYGQDAQYGWDTSHASSERYTRDLSSADEPLLVDNVTGLIWQGCEAGLQGSDCASGSMAAYDWQSALAYCDALSWGGYRDWHLPDPYELDSIADASFNLDSAAFPASHLQGLFYWSSSTSASRSSFAMRLLGSDFDKTYKEPVRCVRGGTALQGPRFARDASVAEEPVVVDNVTGLAWQGCTAGFKGRDCNAGTADYLYWSDWLSYCEGLTWAGKTDWRLPNWKELRSIVDSGQNSPAIDATAFPGTLYDQVYLSSTGGQCIISSINPSDRNCLLWGVLFSDGSLMTSANVVYPGYARCVRDGL